MSVEVGRAGILQFEPNYSLVAALPIFTAFWTIVAVAGIVVPCFFWKYKHRLTVQVSIVLTAICCYIFWLFAYLAQLNPLVGPQLETPVAAHIRRVWAYSQPPGDSEKYEIKLTIGLTAVFPLSIFLQVFQCTSGTN